MKLLFQKIEKIAESHPKDIALECGQVVLSYQELVDSAKRLATRWALSPRQLIGIECSSRAQHLLAMLAVWSSDCAFVPLDTLSGAERRQVLLDSARPHQVTDGFQLFPGSSHSADLNKPTSYVICTSGSTGTPKAVQVGPEGVELVINQQRQIFEVKRNSRVLWMLSPLFDASLSDILTAWFTGATLVVPEAPLAPVELLAFLETRQITHADVPPSYLLHCGPCQRPDGLETLIVGGEVPPASLKAWAQRCRVFNVYGPTEATICASTKQVDASFESTNIGTPFGGVLFKVVDPEFSITEMNIEDVTTDLSEVERGELWIGGVVVAHGYLNSAQLTGERFVSGWYKTGDLVQKDEHGEYHFLGRVDRQVKIRGKLFAPEEVEAAVCTLSGVTGAAVSVDESYVIRCVYEGRVPPTDVETYLTAKLPLWMVPTVFASCERLPRTSSGKIAYKKILWPKGITSNPAESGATRDIWLEQLVEQVLGQPVDSRRSLVANGGDSLTALEVSARALSAGVALSPEVLLSGKALLDAREVDARSTAALVQLVPALSFEKTSRKAKLPLNAGVTRVGLVGATGGLGSLVLRELLARGVEVVALVRGGAVRLSSSLRDHPLLTVISGDLIEPDFGLSGSAQKLLASCSDTINAAGLVNLTRDLAYHWPVNVAAVLNLLKHQAAVPGQRLHHVSTLSVFVHTDHVPKSCTPEHRITRAKKVYGGYAQSKFIADLLVQRAREQGLATHLIRPGLLTPPRSKALGYQWKQNELLRMVLSGLRELGAAPDEFADTLRVDVTPTDWAAAKLVDGVVEGREGCTHLSFGSASLRELVESLHSVGWFEGSSREWLQQAFSSSRSDEAYMTTLALSKQAYRDNRLHAVNLFQAGDTDFCSPYQRATGSEIRQILAQYVAQL